MFLGSSWIYPKLAPQPIPESALLTGELEPTRHQLKEGPHELCYACRQPLLPKEKERSEYEHGVSCHKCKDKTTESDKARFRERQKQIQLSRKRGQKHMAGFDGS